MLLVLNNWAQILYNKLHNIYVVISFKGSSMHMAEWVLHCTDQGPVVQSVVNLTSLLRVISLTVLANSIHNILIFFAEKMWVVFALQKLLPFFSKKFQHICITLDVNFNESLTNDVVSFEQLGPDLCNYHTFIVLI